MERGKVEEEKDVKDLKMWLEVLFDIKWCRSWKIGWERRKSKSYCIYDDGVSSEFIYHSSRIELRNGIAYALEIFQLRNGFEWERRNS